MNQYKELTNAEVEYYKNQLVLPNVIYPHYPPLIIDGINIMEHYESCPIQGEEFRKSTISEKLFVSNYGRVQYENEIVGLNINGTFLHNTWVHIEGLGQFDVYRLVKKAFDPIENMDKFQIHHINNNALDNRPENLIWVTEHDLRRIDNEFSAKLRECEKIIRNNARKQLIKFFRKHKNKSFTGFKVCTHNHNIFWHIIRDTLSILEKEEIIKNIAGKKKFFYDNIYELKLKTPDEIGSRIADALEKVSRLIHGSDSSEVVRAIERVLKKKLSMLSSATDYYMIDDLESNIEIPNLARHDSANQIIKDLEKEDPELAEATKTPEQTKQEAEAAFGRGKTYYEKKDYDLAIKEYSEAIRLDPNFALAYLKRADAYIMAKDELDDDAINDIYKACELDPHIYRQDDNQGEYRKQAAWKI